MKLLPLGYDELAALIILGISLLPLEVAFFETLRPLVILYIFMCLAFRKYEAILDKRK